MDDVEKSINRYEIRRTIGQGGMATVYEAYDGRIGRSVAVRILPENTLDQTSRGRFMREVEIITKLEHPAIVPVYDFGEENGRPYLVMRLMASDMRERLTRGPVSPEEASRALDRLSSALDWIHQRGLIHRNIKPSNILLDEYGDAYLSDFGIVLPIQALTSTGFVGTPAYTSPEEVRGEQVDARTDVYQLGVTLFEMLTGRQPFEAPNSLAVLIKHIEDPIPSLVDANPNLSLQYNRVIIRAMAKDPGDRYKTAGEMARVLKDLVNAPTEVIAAKRVENPFVVGNPVAGDLFVGRADVFARLRELWGVDTAKNVNSVVLFGHRRMGKTSILHNLRSAFGADTVIATFTMQQVGRVTSTGELLSYLALAIFDALIDVGIDGVPEPTPADYKPNGYLTFNRFLREMRQHMLPAPHTNKEAPTRARKSFLGKWLACIKRIQKQPAAATASFRRMILTIDEFELIEEAIADGRVEAEFLGFLRGVIHSEPWLILALAGLHTLEEMTADYWNPLFASVTPVRVSFFSRTATGNLLAQPSANFPLEFTNATVDRIYQLARGQPYLTQLIAHSMVSHYNESVYQRGLVPAPRFAPEDVDAVINSKEFYEQGSYYFNGVWGQAERAGPSGQVNVMTVLASSDIPLTEVDITRQTQLRIEDVRASLRILRQHDVVQITGTGIDFAVPLMRRWIRDVKGLASS